MEVKQGKLSENYINILVEYFKRSGIDYVDNRKKDGRFGILSTGRTEVLKKYLEAKGTLFNAGYIRYSGGKTSNTRRAFWVMVDSFKDEAKSARGYGYIGIDGLNLLTRQGILKDLDKEYDKDTEENGILKDEETIEDRLYVYMLTSSTNFPEGLTARYIAEKMDISKDDIKHILSIVDWVQRRGVHYKFFDNKRNKVVGLDFSKNLSLAFTVPVAITFKGEMIKGIESWKEVLSILASKLYQSHTKNFTRAAIINSSLRLVDGKHKNRLITPYCVGGDLWIELKRSPKEIFMFLKELMDICNLSLDNINIVYKRKDIL